MTATLEYGYRTGRHDPEPRVALSDEAEGRQATIPQQEGLQAEKVIKGLFTGTFHFDVNIIAAADRTPLRVTGTSTSVTNSATTGPVFGFDITMNKTAGALTLIRGTITPAAGSGDNFLLFRSGTTTKWQLTGDGRILMPDSTASFPTLSFINENTSGIHRLAGVTNRWFLVTASLGIFEIELVASSPGDGVRRVRVYGTGNTRSQPNITHGGGIDNNDSGIWWNSEVSGRRKVALVNEIGSMVACYNSQANANETRNCVQISGVINRASSGTHTRFNLLELVAMDDGPANAGLLTDATTLYITGSPDTDTAGKISNFRAIWVRHTTGGGGGVSGGSGGFVDFESDFRVTGNNSIWRTALGSAIIGIRFGEALNFVKSSSVGSHPHLNLLQLDIFTTTGVATHTDATTLYIVGAPNTTTTGGLNRAIWVRSGAGGGLVEFEGLFRVNSTFTAAAGASATLIDFLGTITEAGSGNHARLSLIEFAALGVTAGAATVTNATTVYIAGAPAGVVTGKNRALWVVAGEAEFGGVVTIGLDRGLDFRNQTNQAAAAVGTLNNAPAAGDPAFWVPIVVNGTNRSFPTW